jgi:hypothetical protein
VPLGEGRVAERRYGRLHVLRGEPVAPSPAALRLDGATPFGGLAVRCREAESGLAPALAGAGRLRVSEPGERLAGHRTTVARMLLEARVPQPLRAVYPVVEADGRLVCIPGVAVARAARSRPGLELAVEPA